MPAPARLICLAVVGLLLSACSNTDPGDPDQKMPGPDLSADGPTGRDASVEAVLLPDLGVMTDRAVWFGAQFLTSKHTGWARTDCLNASCHPYASSDKPPVYKCASCHGGNGACNPNGASSTKQDHTAESACTGAGCHDTPRVHPTGSTYTQDVQCVTCHFAKRGGTPDC